MTEVRRVLMSGDTVGGVFSYCLDLARALGERGIEVVLAAMGASATDAQRAAAARVPRLTLLDRDFALEWMDDAWPDVERAGRWLIALEAEVEPDAVHVNGFAHASLPFRSPVIAVAHSSVDSWFHAVKGEAMPDRYARYAREAARGLAAANAIVAPTHAMLRALEPTYGRFESARVIPNGVFVERFVPKEKHPVVLAVGRPWDEAKNVAAVARAARGLPWPVEVVGARSGEHLPPGVRSLGLLGRDEVADRMAHASIFVHPARYEPFGLSAVEAALSGCALVLGDLPSLREVWGDAAVFVPPGDYRVIRDALLRLIEDPDGRATAAATARARALRYCARAMARSYLDVYLEALAGAPRPSSTVVAPP